MRARSFIIWSACRLAKGVPNLEGPHLAVSRCGLALKLLEDVSVRCELVGRKVRRF